MAVTVQGYLALDLVKKNNVELVKGVDRASTTTVAALRTAVTVAQALVGQRLVLEQITALNTTTANMIDSTGELLKNQTAQIHEQLGREHVCTPINNTHLVCRIALEKTKHTHPQETRTTIRKTHK